MTEVVDGPVYRSKHPDSGGHTPVYFDAPERDSPERLDLRLDLVGHSPDGFGWGYGGSGPAQLAVAILAHATSDDFAVQKYQRFKADVVAVQRRDLPLRIPRRDVDAWVEALEL